MCREVEKLAGLCNILLRTGCFCNPGACAAHLGLRQHELISNYEAGHVCWDDNDIINGRPTGAAAHHSLTMLALHNVLSSSCNGYFVTVLMVFCNWCTHLCMVEALGCWHAGAVRVSFGYMSTFDDAYAVLRCCSDTDLTSSPTLPCPLQVQMLELGVGGL